MFSPDLPRNSTRQTLYVQLAQCRLFTHIAAIVVADLSNASTGYLLPDGTTDYGCRPVPVIPRADPDGICPPPMSLPPAAVALLALLALLAIAPCCACAACCVIRHRRLAAAAKAEAAKAEGADPGAAGAAMVLIGDATPAPAPAAGQAAPSPVEPPADGRPAAGVPAAVAARLAGPV
jgi:hypothetical protein